MSTIARISLEQYEIMIEHGVFDGRHRQRVELIRGEIRQMNPIGVEHANAVDVLTEWSVKCVSGKPIRVRVQNPLLLPDSSSAPEPDVAWVAKRDYSRHPLPDDVLLLIEVADSTLAADRGEKAELYAEANIREYWIVNLVDRCVEIFRDPVKGRYRDRSIAEGGAELQPLCCPDILFRPSILFSDPPA